MRKIGVVMTYFDRWQQLGKTLATIARSQQADYHVIIVDDASAKLPYLPSMEAGAIYGAEVIRIDLPQKTWTEAVVPFNMGIARALRWGADIIVLQNAECYHVGDVLMYANDHVTDGCYVSFACWNESRGCADVYAEIARDDPFRTDGGTTGWYNHPKWNPRAFHFCNAFSAEAMRKLNGFDERFKDGIGCDDNDLVRRLQALGQGIVFTDETKPFVVHQWHDRGHQSKAGYLRNEALYGQIMQELGYRAQHIATEDFS